MSCAGATQPSVSTRKARKILRGSIANVKQRALVVLALVCASVSFHAAAPIRYTFSFPEPQHHWMQVEASFPDVGSGTLELRVSRSSPDRYSMHDFAKNVYD